jgi:hypothetical protein
MEFKRLSTKEDPDCEDDEFGSPDIRTAVVESPRHDDAVEEQRTIELKLSDKQQSPDLVNPTNDRSSEKKAVHFGPLLDMIDDNEAPVPISQTAHATIKDTKTNTGLEVLGSDAPPPFEASFHDDSVLREKEKMKESEKEANLHSHAGDDCGGSSDSNIDDRAPDTRAAPHTTLEESISHPCIDEEMQMFPTRVTSRQTETTTPTSMSAETIFDAYSQRASTVRYTEGDQIFIPEATIVEDSIKEDIPAAEVVVPESYSLTIAGKKVHAVALVAIAIVFIILTVGLSVSLTRPPRVNQMPTQYPTIQPSLNPTSEFYSSLAQTIYGDDLDQVEINEDRRSALIWLEQDQANTSSILSDDELRERYALSLLYFISNIDGGWYDDVNFLSDDHVCSWRMKRSGEKKGVLLCDEDDKVLQLSLCKCAQR